VVVVFAFTIVELETVNGELNSGDPDPGVVPSVVNLAGSPE
jgi:hypothetical protein